MEDMSCWSQKHIVDLACSVEQRADLLRHGLEERSPSVQQKAVHLLHTWLQDGCTQQPVKLLKLLEIEACEGMQLWQFLTSHAA